MNSKIKRIRQNYITKLEDEFSKHRILEKLATLEEKAHENFSAHAKETLEKLDLLITALMTHAEKKIQDATHERLRCQPQSQTMAGEREGPQGADKTQTGKRRELSECQANSKKVRNNTSAEPHETRTVDHVR